MDISAFKDGECIVTKNLENTCVDVRKSILEMIYNAQSGHLGGSLSAVELLVALFETQMNVTPSDNIRKNKFVLSKGHAAPCYYAVLAEQNFFSKEKKKNFRQLGSILQGHPDSTSTPGVDASSGSLGQGVSIAVGMALGAKLSENNGKVYSLLGDGELQEGQAWEAIAAAAHYKLDNFTAIVDYNRLQIDGTNDQVMSLGDLPARFIALGYDVIKLEDGNNLQAIIDAYNSPFVTGKPRCIIAYTTKGKGVSIMENQVGWHGKAPSTDEYKQAMEELEKQYV